MSLKTSGIVANLLQGIGSPNNASWDLVIYANSNSASWKLLEDGRIQITDGSGSTNTLGSTASVSDPSKTYMFL